MNASFSSDVIGWYTLTLTVNNGLSTSLPDSVRVHFTGENAQPVANAGGDIDDMDCTDVQLDCSGSTDPEGETLSYWWILQSKPENSAVDNRSIRGQSIANPTFWPDVAGEYTMSCSVYDGTSWSHPDTITLNISERDYNTPPLSMRDQTTTWMLGMQNVSPQRAPTIHTTPHGTATPVPTRA